jgi:pSer/pThr/pTyr-binding forkhead associated (FHA) protein
VTLRIVHTFGRNAGAVAVLDKPVVRFGRAPENDVVFDAHYDRDASSQHAELRLDGSTWVLLDLGSRNGTYVGGRRITRHVVASGDEVLFGAKGPRVRIELLAGAAPAVTPAPCPRPRPCPPP